MESEFNIATEIVAAWLLVGMFFCVVSLVYYLTVVRVPPRPMFDKYFALITVPLIFERIIKRISQQSSNYVARLRTLNKEIELKPLTSATSSDIARSTSEDMAAAIIGVPLDDDEENGTK